MPILCLWPPLHLQSDSCQLFCSALLFSFGKGRGHLGQSLTVDQHVCRFCPTCYCSPSLLILHSDGLARFAHYFVDAVQFACCAQRATVTAALLLCSVVHSSAVVPATAPHTVLSASAGEPPQLSASFLSPLACSHRPLQSFVGT